MPQTPTLRGGRIDHVSEDERTTRLARKSGNLARKRNTSEMQESLPHFFLLPLLLSASSSSRAQESGRADVRFFQAVYHSEKSLWKVVSWLWQGNPAGRGGGEANEEQSLATLGRVIGGAVFCDIARGGTRGTAAGGVHKLCYFRSGRRE